MALKRPLPPTHIEIVFTVAHTGRFTVFTRFGHWRKSLKSNWHQPVTRAVARPHYRVPLIGVFNELIVVT